MAGISDILMALAEQWAIGKYGKEKVEAAKKIMSEVSMNRDGAQQLIQKYNIPISKVQETANTALNAFQRSPIAGQFPSLADTVGKMVGELGGSSTTSDSLIERAKRLASK